MSELRVHYGMNQVQARQVQSCNLCDFALCGFEVLATSITQKFLGVDSQSNSPFQLSVCDFRSRSTHSMTSMNIGFCLFKPAKPLRRIYLAYSLLLSNKKENYTRLHPDKSDYLRQLGLKRLIYRNFMFIQRSFPNDLPGLPVYLSEGVYATTHLSIEVPMKT